MSDLKDYSDKDTFEFLCNNKNRLIPVMLMSILLLMNTIPIICYLNLIFLSSNHCQRICWIWLKIKLWSSKFFVRDSDEMIDISSAAQGKSPTVPCGATQQAFPFPGTAYRFDPLTFHGENADFDINETADEVTHLH
jgi:hypothetical protein